MSPTHFAYNYVFRSTCHVTPSHCALFIHSFSCTTPKFLTLSKNLQPLFAWQYIAVFVNHKCIHKQSYLQQGELQILLHFIKYLSLNFILYLPIRNFLFLNATYMPFDVLLISPWPLIFLFIPRSK